MSVNVQMIDGTACCTWSRAAVRTEGGYLLTRANILHFVVENAWMGGRALRACVSAVRDSPYPIMVETCEVLVENLHVQLKWETWPGLHLPHHLSPIRVGSSPSRCRRHR